MSSLLEKLKAGKRNAKTVKFPGTEHDVVIRVLTSQEVQDAELAAERLFKGEEIGYGPSTVETWEKEKTLQMLHLALRDPSVPERTFARDVDELRSLITESERSVLVVEYEALQEECSPSLDRMTDEEFGALLEEVKKRPDEAASSISNIFLLQRLVITLASRPASSRKASGSTSS